MVNYPALGSIRAPSCSRPVQIGVTARLLRAVYPSGLDVWPSDPAPIGDSRSAVLAPQARNRPSWIGGRVRPRCRSCRWRSAQLPSGIAPFESDPCALRSEEHTSELQSLMRISYAVFCL